MILAHDENVAMVDASGKVTIIAEGNVTTEITNVVINQLPIEANLAPNPNEGSFVLKVSTGTPYDATVSYQITNMAGQIIASLPLVHTCSSLPVATSAKLSTLL